ncbi:MAG: chemotaxis protein CheA [Bacillales bacterium]|jgi:two-component system chemotaxis sensor kinase CheA|nr:chemotaxis protein CheA [Bacillales bacterium]
MDMNQYLEVFIEESKEHLQNVNDQLLELEKKPDDVSIVNEIFRSAHTLKGMSATMGYEDLANLTHKMENVLDAIRNNKIKVTSEILDVVFLSVDDLEAMVLCISTGGDGKRDVTNVVDLLQKIEKGEPVQTKSTQKNEIKVEPIVDLSNETFDQFQIAVFEQSNEQGFHNYKIKVTLREDCLLKAARAYMVFEILEQIGEIVKTFPSSQEIEEEKFDHDFTVFLASKEDPGDIRARINKVSEISNVEVDEFNIAQYNESKNEQEIINKEKVSAQVSETNAASNSVQPLSIEKPEETEKSQAKSVGNKTIRVNIERLDILMNLFEELVIDRGRLEQISKDLNNTELVETVERMSRISGDLQNIILNMRMVPVDTVFNRFPRMVRQLAKDLGKKIELDIVGAETELDRTVIDEIGDPLVHLIRNALDHGVESPEVRKAAGKNETGQVTLRAYHSGNHVFIEIQDDGAGINKEKVLKKAITKGVITEQSAALMTDKQIFDLIFASGLSTADKISDVSGRGVGLDVVKNTIESLGGSVSIDSELGKGSLFLVQLPLTLSIISVMLVEIEKEKFAIPLSSIIETAIVKKSEILNAHNQKVIDFRGRVVPLIFLKEIFDVPRNASDDNLYSVIIVRKGDKLAGLVVDSFIGQQEIVLKSLGDYLQTVFAISGATILGDGQVALIIDCNALIK